jgi:sulfur carrier protein ThiS
VIAEPPLLEGASQDTTTCVDPTTPETAVGAPGTVAGTTVPEALDAAPVPPPFVAVTVNV